MTSPRDPSSLYLTYTFLQQGVSFRFAYTDPAKDTAVSHHLEEWKVMEESATKVSGHQQGDGGERDQGQCGGCLRRLVHWSAQSSGSDLCVLTYLQR